MKVKIIKEKQVIDESILAFLGGMLIAGFLAFLGRKFFVSMQQDISVSGKKIDTGTEMIVTALKKEEKVYPEAKTLGEKIVVAKQKLSDKIKKIKEDATDVDKISDMRENPSKLIESAITEFEQEIEFQTAEKELSEAAQEKIDEARKIISDSASILKNIDKLVLMADRKRSDGLWNAVIVKTDMGDKFKNEKDWKDFIKLLVKYTD